MISPEYRNRTVGDIRAVREASDRSADGIGGGLKSVFEVTRGVI